MLYIFIAAVSFYAGWYVERRDLFGWLKSKFN